MAEWWSHGCSMLDERIGGLTEWGNVERLEWRGSNLAGKFRGRKIENRKIGSGPLTTDSLATEC
jgi:hypothetical protein